MNSGNKFSKTVDAQTFGSVMGNVVWLMSMSKDHRDLPIHTVETLLSPAILLRQFRLFSKDEMPVACVIWASVSDEIKERLDQGGALEDLKEWRSGTNIVILDCISPMAEKETFEQKFLASVAQAQAQKKTEQE